MAEDAVRLAPDAADVGHEAVRDGWKTRSKLSGRKRERSAMSPSTVTMIQPLALGDEAVLRELGGRGVEEGDGRAGGGEDGRLLAAAGRQAEHVEAAYDQPGTATTRGHGLQRREDDAPLRPRARRRSAPARPAPSSGSPGGHADPRRRGCEGRPTDRHHRHASRIGEPARLLASSCRRRRPRCAARRPGRPAPSASASRRRTRRPRARARRRRPPARPSAAPAGARQGRAARPAVAAAWRGRRPRWRCGRRRSPPPARTRAPRRRAPCRSRCARPPSSPPCPRCGPPSTGA